MIDELGSTLRRRSNRVGKAIESCLCGADGIGVGHGKTHCIAFSEKLGCNTHCRSAESAGLRSKAWSGQKSQSWCNRPGVYTLLDEGSMTAGVLDIFGVGVILKLSRAAGLRAS